MKKTFKLWAIFAFLVMLGGCMELLPIDRDQVSKINSFSIIPANGIISKGSSFTINIEATVGNDVNIYFQNTVSGALQRVYTATNKEGYDQIIIVKYEGSSMGVGNLLTSDSKGWVDTAIIPTQDYFVFAKACDVANIPGNALCSTSNGARIAFINN